jgi:hypothetical protein
LPNTASPTLRHPNATWLSLSASWPAASCPVEVCSMQAPTNAPEPQTANAVESPSSSLGAHGQHVDGTSAPCRTGLDRRAQAQGALRPGAEIGKPRHDCQVGAKMKRTLLVLSHLLVLVIGFALGTRTLPIPVAPSALSPKDIEALMAPTLWT